MTFFDDRFVDIDLVLRAGGHINRSNLVAFEYACQNFDALEQFYKQFGCNLRQHPDGFFCLKLQNSKIRSRLLPKSCVHLGIFIALKARDPEITRSAGRIGINQLLQDIETSVPRETLQKVYAPKRRDVSVDESISEEIHKALKTLAELRFIDLLETSIRPLEAINRFAEMARHNNVPDDDARLQMTIQRGVVFADEGEESGNGEEDES